jgi:response regulator RpfG family c-di-GMP phosphodiesterase
MHLEEMRARMSKSTHTGDSRAVLLVDASEQEVVRLRNEMPGWHWEQAANDWPFDLEGKRADCPLDAVIVFASKNEESRALDISRRICEDKSTKDIPLLVAASRYQMSLVNELRQLPLVDFIFTPIDENTLLDKIKKNTDVIA